MDRPASPKKRLFRKQTGSIIRRSDGFYIRFYKPIDGVRTKVTERLCDLTVIDRQKRQLLADAHLSAINNQHHREVRSIADAPRLTVVEFWEQTYLPFVADNLKTSTVFGYQHVWNAYLKDHFGAIALSDYKTPMMTNFLTSHTKTLRPRTLKHMKFLASGIFSHAVATGHCETNPIRDAT
jgi:hypothetical protein